LNYYLKYSHIIVYFNNIFGYTITSYT